MAQNVFKSIEKSAALKKKKILSHVRELADLGATKLGGIEMCFENASPRTDLPGIAKVVVGFRQRGLRYGHVIKLALHADA